MAAQTQEKVIRIRMDVGDAISNANRVNQAVNQIGTGGNLSGISAQFDSITKSVLGSNSALKSANDNIIASGHAASEAGEGFLEWAGHIGKVALALGGLSFLIGGLHEIAEALMESSDASTEVAARLAAVTQSSKELADAQAAVAAIAGQTRQNLTDTAELYQKIGIQADHLGLSQKGVSLATKTFAETLKIAGATTQQSQAAMRQLGEAFDVGQLQGRHFLAMQQDNIIFMRLLAQSMDVPMGKLKELSSQGKVTADDLKKALTDPSLVSQTQANFDRMPVSFADVRTAIRNTLAQLAGDFGEGAGLNTGLRNLYKAITDFGTSAKPEFEKIGVAFKAAFESFAPVIGAAISTIKPFFEFVLNNAPQIISVVKVGAEAWLAYRAATAAVAAVDLAKGFVTTVSGLMSLVKTVTGAGSAMSLLKIGAAYAAEGFEALTAVMMANPFVAVATAVTAVIALLYEFRDSISLGGGTMASLGDLFRATWQALGPMISSAVSAVKTGFADIWSAVSTVFGYIGDGLSVLFSPFKPALDAVEGWFKNTFGDLDFSIAGVLTGAARVADGIVGVFRGGFNALTVLWNEAPSQLGFQWLLDDAKSVWNGIVGVVAWAVSGIVSLAQSIASGFATVFNAVAGYVERFANTTLDAVNLAISGANKLGAGLPTFQHVKLQVDLPTSSTVAPGAAKLGADMGKAFQAGFGHEAENGVKGLLANAAKIGAARRAAGASPTEAAAGQIGGPEGAAGGDKDKKAAERAKKEAEFWQTLQNEVVTAGQFGLAQQQATKELELQKILGTALNADQKARVDSLVQEVAQTKAVTSLKQALFNAQNQYTVDQQRGIGLTASQKAVEDELYKYRLSALNSGADINSADYKTAEAALKVQIDKNQALTDQNNLLKQASDFIKKYNDNSGKLDELDQQMRNAQSAFDSGNLRDQFGKPVTQAVFDGAVEGWKEARAKIADEPMTIAAKYSDDLKRQLDIKAVGEDKSKVEGSDWFKALDDNVKKKVEDGFGDAIDKIKDQWIDDFSNAFSQLATDFGGKFGAILNKLAGAFKEISSSLNGTDGLGQLAKALGGGEEYKNGAKSVGSSEKLQQAISDPINSLKSGFSDFKNIFTSQSGGFMKGLSTVLGKASQGMAIADATNSIAAPLEKLLGVKNSKTGSEIGGAIGGTAFGPIGAIAGSLLGGIVGGLFKKTPKGGDTVSINQYGSAVAGTAYGNNAKAEAAATDAAGAVSQGLNQIAQALGGTLSGNANVAIGTYNGKWRVNTSGTKLGGSSSPVAGLTDYGKDGEQDAIEAAISAALKQGVLKGISSFSQKVLQSATDLDSAINIAEQWEGVLKGLQSYTDPVTAAVNAVIQPLDTLRQTMVGLGATTDDLTKLDQYRADKLADVLKQETASLTDFQKTLKGDLTGTTKLDQLNADMAQFETYKKQIDAGSSSVNQSDYTSLGNEILQLVNSIYGTSTPQAQAFFTELTDTTNEFMTNVTNAFNTAAGTGSSSTSPTTTDATTTAITNMTSAITSQQVIQTDLLKQLVANTANNNGSSPKATVTYPLNAKAY